MIRSTEWYRDQWQSVAASVDRVLTNQGLRGRGGRNDAKNADVRIVRPWLAVAMDGEVYSHPNVTVELSIPAIPVCYAMAHDTCAIAWIAHEVAHAYLLNGQTYPKSAHAHDSDWAERYMLLVIGHYGITGEPAKSAILDARKSHLVHDDADASRIWTRRAVDLIDRR